LKKTLKNLEMLNKYLEENYITQIELDVVAKMANSSHHSVDEILMACGFVTSKEVALIKAHRLQTRYFDLKEFTPHVEALELIPRSKLIEYSVLPLMIEDSKLVVSIDERSDYKHQNYFKKYISYNINIYKKIF